MKYRKSAGTKIMANPIEAACMRQLEARIKDVESENRVLQKELAVKSVISEISQFQGKEDKIEVIYNRIFTLLSDIIRINNFYIAIIEDNNISIPFFVDQYDDQPVEMLNEKTNPQIRESLTGYALINAKSLVLDEESILKLQKESKLKVFGKIPKQWVFLPFHNENIKGGMVAQSYTKLEKYSYPDISILAYVTMHVGNFISAYNAKEKIKQQYEELKAAQSQLVHSEKMASIGQLAAGVAHEINNPLGYVNSNLNSLKGYVDDFACFVDEVTKAINDSPCQCDSKKFILETVNKAKEEHDIDFILSDTGELVSESIFGMDKVKNIIQSLKNFSHSGEGSMQQVDINVCIEETIRIVWNELKYHCELTKEYGELPETYCHPSQLNQVFMNLLINAGHAIKEKGVITITTSCQDDSIMIEIRDNGSGIDEEHISQLFNPFFTTKAVGEGTGLGLSISYGIIESHGGKIEVESKIAVGTCFKIQLPVIREK